LNHHANHTVWDGIAVARPGCSIFKAGKGNEQQFPAVKLVYLRLFTLEKADTPSHEQQGVIQYPATARD